MELKKTILVVEDFVIVQRFIRDTLEARGYQTIGASTGKQAFEILLNQGIDLVLTDYHMPDGTGFDLLKRIKANQQLAQKPVLFLTTEANPKVIDNVKAVANVTWITKPYKSDTLFTEIERALVES